MTWYNHVNICLTHPQSFKQCRTSVVTVVAKCIFSVALVISCHTRGSMLFTFPWWNMLLCLQVFWFCEHSQFITMFTSVSLIPHLAKFQKLFSNLASSSLLELCIAQSQPSSYNLASWNFTMRSYCLQELHTMKFLYSSPDLGLQNYTIMSSSLAPTVHCTVSRIKPNPWALELCNCTITWDPMPSRTMKWEKLVLNSSVWLTNLQKNV